MQTCNVRQARENLSTIFKSGNPVEVNHPTHPVIILPKEQYYAMEDELMLLQMEKAEAQSKRKYTSEEVEAMVASVRKDKIPKEQHSEEPDYYSSIMVAEETPPYKKGKKQSK